MSARDAAITGLLSQGLRGETGEIGPQGETGERGDVGRDGQRGADGPQGPTGAQGDTGDTGTGDEGPAGPKGDKGDTGPAGPPGERGLTGKKGEKGDPGSNASSRFPGGPGLPPVLLDALRAAHSPSVANPYATISDVGGGGVTVSATDPGALGAGALWLEVIFGNETNDGGNGRLWVRNSTDDGWNSAGPVTYSDATSTTVASPNDHAELYLPDSGGGHLTDTTSLQLRGGAQRLFLDNGGLHLGATGSVAGFAPPGSVDPTAGAGIAAPTGTLYIRTDGTLWQKTDTGDTDWDLVGVTLPITPEDVTGTAVVDADARLSDSRIPLSHNTTHGAMGADPISIDVGQVIGTAVIDNDVRLTDSRTPTAHASSHWAGGSDPFAAAHVADGASVDDLRDALVAAGLMAAS